MVEEHINFNSDGLKLEGVLSYDVNALNPPPVLLCPPHPQLGGDMDNNVITVLGKRLAENGFAPLRFNYRGVGNSESGLENIAEVFKYWEEVLNNDNYSDALVDAESSLDFLVSTFGRNQLYVTGYSFGAVVAMRLGVNHEEVKACASISMPFSRFDTSFLSDCRKPKLFIAADNDFATSLEDVKRGMITISEPQIVDIMKNCDHFYRDREHEVANKVLQFFKRKIVETI